MLHLGIVDNAILYNMTPKEYNIKIKGKMLQDVQKYEDMSIQAIFNQRAKGKRMSSKKLFDADKARKNILNPVAEQVKEREKRDYSNLSAALAALNKKGE